MAQLGIYAKFHPGTYAKAAGTDDHRSACAIGSWYWLRLSHNLSALLPRLPEPIELGTRTPQTSAALQRAHNKAESAARAVQKDGAMEGVEHLHAWSKSKMKYAEPKERFSPTDLEIQPPPAGRGTVTRGAPKFEP